MAKVREWEAEFERVQELDLDALVACLEGVKATSPMIFKEFIGLDLVKTIAERVLQERRDLPYWGVSIMRTGRSCRVVTVRARSAQEAEQAALETAGDLEFPEHTSSYTTDYITRVSRPGDFRDREDLQGQYDKGR